VYLAGKESAKARTHLEALLAQGMQRPDAYLLLAAAHRMEKDARRTEETLKQGLERNGKDQGLHRALADLYASQGRTEEAAVEMRKVIELDPANSGNRITLAGLYWGAKQPEKARSALNELLAAKPDDEAVRLDVARFYAKLGGVADAERELKVGIARNGKSLRPRLALGALYLNSGRVDNAVVLLRECLTLEEDSGSPEILQARNLLALAHMAKGELDPALKSVDAAIKASTGNVEAHLIKGRIRLLQKDGAGAVAEFRTVVHEKPQAVQGYLYLAEAHLLKKEPGLTLETLQNALKVDPKSRDVRRTLSRYYMTQNDPGKAEGELRRILEENPADVEVSAELGDLYASRKEYAKAEAAYADVKRRAPKHPLGYVKAGEYQISRGDWKRSTVEFEQAVNADPGSGPLLSALVRLYMKQGRAAEAVSACEAHVRRDGGDAFDWRLLGQVHAEQKEYRKAEGAFRKALAAKPDAMETYLLLGRMYLREGDFPKGRAVYEEALARQPGFWPAANDLAVLLCERAASVADLDKALSLAQNALKRRPEDPAVQDTLGWIWYRKGDVGKALEMLQRAQGKVPESAEIIYHLGMVLFKAGRREEAKMYLKKSVAGSGDFPGREEAARTLAGI
jgi:tetratricopeptide (TPR) repeat protein